MQPLHFSFLLNCPVSKVFCPVNPEDELRLATPLEAARFALEALKRYPIAWVNQPSVGGAAMDMDVPRRYADMIAAPTFPRKELEYLSVTEFFEYTQLMLEHKVGDEAGLALCAARIIMSSGYPNPLHVLRTQSDDGLINHISLKIIAVTDRPEDACELNACLSLMPEDQQHVHFGSSLDARIDNPACFYGARASDNLFVIREDVHPIALRAASPSAVSEPPRGRQLLRASELPVPFSRAIVAQLQADPKGGVAYKRAYCDGGLPF